MADQQQQQQAWMDQVQAQLAQLQQQNQQLAAQLAQPAAPAAMHPKLPKPKPEARLRQTGETVQRYHAPATSSGPTPMVINMVGSEQRPFTGRCFKCGEPGHKAVNCRRRQGQHGGFATPPAGAKQRPKTRAADRGGG